jgi:hypothetical protein
VIVADSIVMFLSVGSARMIASWVPTTVRPRIGARRDAWILRAIPAARWGPRLV